MHTAREIHQKAPVELPVRRICQLLSTAPSSFYQAAKPSKKAIADQHLTKMIHQIYLARAKRYGYRRVHAELRHQGVDCTLAAVRRIMHRHGWLGLRPRPRQVPRSSDGKALPPAPNILITKDPPTAPNQAWAGDITFIALANGRWAYLAIVMDLFSRYIIGWSLRADLRAELVADALQKALQRRPKPQHGLFFHSDRGGQYRSDLFTALLARSGIDQSMSAPGNPYHNAIIESTFSRLKVEYIHGQTFRDLHHAQHELFKHIDLDFNHIRLHSALDYLPPATFEQRHHQSLITNQRQA